MDRKYTESETIAAIPRLTHDVLIEFVQAGIVLPAHADTGLVFARADLARIELLCDLIESFDLSGDALAMVISLIDQLHNTRHSFRSIVEALEAEPQEVRHRIGLRVIKSVKLQTGD